MSLLSRITARVTGIDVEKAAMTGLAVLFLGAALLTTYGWFKRGAELEAEIDAHQETRIAWRTCEAAVAILDGKVKLANQATLAARREAQIREQAADAAVRAALEEVAKANRTARIDAFKPAPGQSECDALHQLNGQELEAPL